VTRIQRQWGYYDILLEGDGYLVKELTIMPGKYLSDQKHQHRSEEWLVVSGSIKAELQRVGGNIRSLTLEVGDKITIPAKSWHHVGNTGDTPAKVIEVWMGDKLLEEDIERRSPCKAHLETRVDSCELHNVHDICIHCGRTERDITHWQEMTHEEKKQANLLAKKRLKGVWHK
jgi:mannose-1-phosphate guanylyltransferase/mannose-6-phosphate isomerase